MVLFGWRGVSQAVVVRCSPSALAAVNSVMLHLLTFIISQLIAAPAVERVWLKVAVLLALELAN